MPTDHHAAAAASSGDRPRRWAFALVCLTYGTATVGEQLLSPLFPTARRDLGLTTGQGGVAFAVLAVSINGYRTWKRGGTPDRTRWIDCHMRAQIRANHAELQGAYGSTRIVRELRTRRFSASKHRPERLMRGNGILARSKRRDKATTDSKHGLPVAENLLARNFTPTAPSPV